MVYLGKQVEAAKVTDNTIDFWQTFAFSIGLKKKMKVHFLVAEKYNVTSSFNSIIGLKIAEFS